ncbi:TPA: hypothetical protein HA238_03130 [Candidatus Micrarchaeota archaeon]|nr:hypothetical protein [Candidatus Micrarchaeota archaeon]
MQFVIDANILFAALIKDSLTHEIIVSEFAEFFAPEFILGEFYMHETEILQKTKELLKNSKRFLKTWKSE